MASLFLFGDVSYEHNLTDQCNVNKIGLIFYFVRKIFLFLLTIRKRKEK
jgi:hypothetical protein